MSSRASSPAPLSGLALLAACGSPDLTSGIAPEVAETIAHCEVLEGSARDWCAIQGLDDSLVPQPGTETVKVCERLRDEDAHDRCIELSVRVHVDPAGPEHCDAIHDDMMRHSCWLSDADRQMSEPIATVMSVCERAGPLLRHCAVHVATHRQDYWREHGFGTMTSDVRAILDTVEGLEASIEFGQGVGYAARDLGLAPGMSGPCDAFRYGNGKMACESAVLGRAVGVPQGSPLGSPTGANSSLLQAGNAGGAGGAR